MRIMIIEDEEALIEVLEYSLLRAGFNVNSFGNANDALIALEDCPPDLILLDLMLPGLKGLQFLEILRQRNKVTPVIIISARQAEVDIIRALELGADDYVPKPFSLKLVEAKIKAVLRRGGAGDGRKLEGGGITIDLESHKALNGGEPLQLTQKEFELLALFLKKPERTFTRNQLLNLVWGYDSDLVTRTVDAHVAALRKKLGDKGRLIKTLPKVGYLWDEKGG
ncbi:MAG: response regulator transcription factor [Deltaproteobacteria bacterium]|nr:response regulator transcription factor [Deltaproteobacteria bacterium]